MQTAYFQILVRDPAPEAQALNQLLASQRIVSLDQQLVPAGADSFWAVSVSFEAGSPAGGVAAIWPGTAVRTGANPRSSVPLPTKRERIDYRNVLSEADFAIYARLREWRKAQAERDQVPSYAIFSNEQMAQIVQQRVATLQALGEIDGIGRSRLERHGAQVIELMQQCLATTASTAPAAAGGEPLAADEQA